MLQSPSRMSLPEARVLERIQMQQVAKRLCMAIEANLSRCDSLISCLFCLLFSFFLSLPRFICAKKVLFLSLHLGWGCGSCFLPPRKKDERRGQLGFYSTRYRREKKSLGRRYIRINDRTNLPAYKRWPAKVLQQQMYKCIVYSYIHIQIFGDGERKLRRGIYSMEKAK